MNEVQVPGIEVKEITIAEWNRLLARNPVPRISGEKVVPLRANPPNEWSIK